MELVCQFLYKNKVMTTQNIKVNQSGNLRESSNYSMQYTFSPQGSHSSNANESSYATPEIGQMSKSQNSYPSTPQVFNTKRTDQKPKKEQQQKQKATQFLNRFPEAKSQQMDIQRSKNSPIEKRNEKLHKIQSQIKRFQTVREAEPQQASQNRSPKQQKYGSKKASDELKESIGLINKAGHSAAASKNKQQTSIICGQAKDKKQEKNQKQQFSLQTNSPNFKQLDNLQKQNLLTARTTLQTPPCKIISNYSQFQDELEQQQQVSQFNQTGLKFKQTGNSSACNFNGSFNTIQPFLLHGDKFGRLVVKDIKLDHFVGYLYTTRFNISYQRIENVELFDNIIVRIKDMGYLQLAFNSSKDGELFYNSMSRHLKRLASSR